LHYWYHNMCMFTVTYVIAVCFQDIFGVSSLKVASSVETCSSYVKDWEHKLQNSAFFGGVTWVSYFINMHGLNNVNPLNIIPNNEYPRVNWKLNCPWTTHVGKYQSGGLFPTVSDFDMRWKWLINITLCPLQPPEKQVRMEW
jgi:hypothetical protein